MVAQAVQGAGRPHSDAAGSMDRVRGRLARSCSATHLAFKRDGLAGGKERTMGLPSEEERAGDGIRTHDVSLGKAAFYH